MTDPIGTAQERELVNEVIAAVMANVSAGARETVNLDVTLAQEAVRDALQSRIAEVERLTARVRELEAQLNTPEVDDFAKGAALEAAHQRERWPSDHDAGKTPFDWFWLIGYLSQKAASAAVVGDAEKAKHHTISTAAALANWHLALSGTDTRMRPGIEPPRAALSLHRRPT